MAFLGACILIVGFVLLFVRFRILEMSKESIQMSLVALSELRSFELDDDAKEATLRKHAKYLFVRFLVILTGALGAVVIPFSLVWLLARFSLFTVEAVLEVTFSWPFLLASSIAVIFACWLAYRKKQ